MANSKCSKHSNRCVDRISTLPESLLCHIISLLPTHYAVQTSILSKRWKNLWTSITSLDFDDEFFADPNLPLFEIDEENKRFEHFIFRVLVLLKTPYLHKFRLNCVNVRDPFHVTTWASAALSRDVRELSLSVYLPNTFEIPISLFTCKTLTSLSLECDTTLDVPNSFCLPKLKYMYLASVKYINDKSVPNLLSGCPALEDLTFERTDPDNVVHFRISSTSLKSLHLNVYFVSGIQLESPRQTHRIDAPKLQYLYLYNRISSNFVIQSMSSLTKADIDVHVSERNNEETGYGDEVLKLLNCLSNVKFLELSGSTMKALSYARVHAIPDLPNLVRLEGDFRKYKHESWCIQPDQVPRYLLSRLTKVVISDFLASSNELEMVKFILNGAKTVERMTIFTSLLEVTHDLLQTITMFPRASKLCELVVKQGI